MYNTDKSWSVIFLAAKASWLNATSRERGIENFKGSGIEKSTEASKESVLRRISCIEAVHRIRCILVKECFIGTLSLANMSSSFTFFIRTSWTAGLWKDNLAEQGVGTFLVKNSSMFSSPPLPPSLTSHPPKMIFWHQFPILVLWNLLNKVWGLHGKTGLFAHTDVPVMHRITSKVTINTINIFEILVILPCYL